MPGTAVFMFRNLNAVPPALLQNLRHNHVLHERNVIVCVQISEDAHVPADERIELRHPGDHLFGFNQAATLSLPTAKQTLEVG